MSVSNPRKSILPTVMDCQANATVTIGFDAAPELMAEPADIVLIMDRSGSMGGAPMEEAKLAAKALVQTVAKASGSTDGNTLQNGTRMCLVTFSDVATRSMGLVTDVALLNDDIDAMKADGNTNHSVAFSSAFNVLQPSTTPRRIAIMFTDGNTTAGSDPQRMVDHMKKYGIEIYCIGLLTDVEPLKNWASDPDSAHVAHTNDLAQLQRVFAEIAAEVVLAGVRDLNLLEVLNPDFRITKVHAPSHGTAESLDGQTIRWTADAVGAAGSETATLQFDVTHIGAEGGTKLVNRSLTFQDRAGTQLAFPNPQVTVRCSGETIWPEPCPIPTHIQVDGCKDTVRAHLIDTKLSSLGRIVQVDATIREVCRDKALAVAVILSEEDAEGVEHQRGMKVMTIPAQSGTDCRDLTLRCVEFAVPEMMDSADASCSLCKPRNFKARVVANYLDGDVVQRQAETVIR